MSQHPLNRTVRQERTGWRDEQISQRHRLYGYDAPALDIDFLMIEYNAGQPVALVEYKLHSAQPVNLAHPSLQAIRVLANAASIPFLIAYYHPVERWWYYVIPANDLARHYIHEAHYLSELDYVTLLYTLRNRQIPDAIKAQLNTFKPVVKQAE